MTGATDEGVPFGTEPDGVPFGTEPDGVPFGTKLRQLAESDPDGVGVVVVAIDRTERVETWATLEAGANRWCRVLQAHGAGVGDLVALAVPNSVELLHAILGAWKAGSIPVPVRWDLPDWERDRVLAVIGAAVVVDADSLPQLGKEAAEADSSQVVELVSPQINGICSSGATGTPKVIMSTRPAVWTPALSDPFISNWQGATRPQVILVLGPMYHTNGFAQLNFLLGGDRLVVLEKFDAGLALDVIERHRVTSFTATPTMLQRIAAVPGVEQRDLSTVEWILQGAAVMPPALLRKWFELLAPEKVVMAYGMTEQLGLTALRGDEWLQHEGSVGRGFRETEIRILGEDGNEVPTGELGDIYMRSPLTGSYDYRGGAALLPMTADGFGTAGDIGRVDEDGFLYLADRRVDMIVTGGANVFPAEVESALSDHPGIADVVVIGLKDEQWGRRVHAVVEPKDKSAPPTEADVIAHAKAKLAGYKVPKSVEFVDAIPRSAATKVSRGAMVDARGG
jgi:bile acid-coenzyme A ligase